MKYLIVIAMAAILAACAGQPLSQQEAALIQAQMEQQTLTVDCPAGCSVSYRDPRDTVQIPRHTNGWDATIAVGQSLERVVSGAVPVIGMGYLGVEAVKAMKGSGTVTTITNTDITDYSGSVGDYSGQGSGNAGTIYSDNAGRINSPDRISDRTHPPTVIEQPVIVYP